jgi:hypothetical protein
MVASFGCKPVNWPGGTKRRIPKAPLRPDAGLADDSPR